LSTTLIFAKPFKQEDGTKLCFYPPSIALFLPARLLFFSGIHSETCQALDSSLDGSYQNKVDFTVGKPNEFTKSLQPGIHLVLQDWVPEAEDEDMKLKAVVIIHHGDIGWHSGYFDLLVKD
jgi:hypothetical protein